MIKKFKEAISYCADMQYSYYVIADKTKYWIRFWGYNQKFTSSENVEKIVKYPTKEEAKKALDYIKEHYKSCRQHQKAKIYRITHKLEEIQDDSNNKS